MGTRYLEWPGCRHEYEGKLTDAEINRCGPPCHDAKLVAHMDEFNSRHSWMYVTFPSAAPITPGQQQLNLTGWWLPVDEAFYGPKSPKTHNRTPVIVLQHGLNVNFNSRVSQVYAYLLRSIGFNTFMPNLRDHGSSAKSSHYRSNTWGYDYYLDLLGAWQFVVDDPQG